MKERQRILVVEDQLIVARDLKGRLQELGYQPIADTPRGEEAIELAGQLRPDLILMDIRLAGPMDGVEAAKRIREQLEIPVVFLTAHAEDSTLDRAKQAEPYGYIVKPFEDQELRTVIEMAVHKHRAEARVRSSERRMKAIVQTAMDGFWIVNRELRLVDVNQAACDLLGYSREEMLELTLTDVEADDPPEVIRATVSAMVHSGGGRFERRHRRKDGRLVRVEISVRHLPEENGLLCCFLRNVTERHDAEAALRLSESRLAKAQQIAHMGSWEMSLTNPADLSPSGLHWSDEVFRIFGYEPGQVQVSNDLFLNSAHPDDRARIRRMLQEAVATGNPYRCEHRIVRPDGEQRIVLEMGEVSTDAAGASMRVLGTVQDITDLRRAQAALQHREAELSAIYEHAPIIMCLLDRDLRVLRLNRVGREFIGHAATDLSGVRPGDVLGCLGALDDPNGCGHGPSCAQCPLRNSLADTLATGRSHIGVKASPALVKGVQTQDFHVIIHTARLSIGDELRVLLCLEDVSSRQAAEDRLEETSNLLRVLLENLSAGTLVEDEQGHLLHVNHQFCTLFGLVEGAESLLHQHARGVLQRSQAQLAAPEAFLMRIDELRRRAQPVFDEQLLLVDGRVFSRDYTPLRLGPNRPAHLWTYRDISEQKRVENRLRQQAALLEVAHDAIIVADVAGPVQFMNYAATELLGRTLEEAMGKDLRSVIRAALDAQLSLAFQEVQSRGEWSGELELTNARADLRVVDSRWALVTDAAGQKRSVLITCNDITEKKQLEVQYLRAQRLESVGTLASGVAHDLNNVLTPIIMGVDVLKESVTLPEDRTLLTMMAESAARGKETVKQLLTFARGTVTQKGPVQLRHVIKEVVRLLQQTLPKNIQIYSDYSSGPSTVMADPSQLHQVLMNLCVNAKDAMPDGGVLSVTLRGELLESTAPKLHPKSRPGRYAVLTVADTGTGIPSDVLPRIFDPFYTTKPLGKGTGLGLATVLGIVESDGGFVLVDTKPEQGTAFRVYLPALGVESAAGGAEAVPTAPRGRGELILVVDDEQAILRIAESLLSHNGYQVILAPNSSEALRLFDKHRTEVRVVLTDVMMPFGDGRELVTHLRQRAPDLPVVAMSGLISPESKAELLQRGAHAFLSKPFSAFDLLTVLENVLRPSSTGSAPPA